jgi:hypothetical protein
MRKKLITPEQKVATKIASLVSDVTIDLEQVGISIARDNPNVVYRRLQEIAEVAEHDKMSKGQGIIEL